MNSLISRISLAAFFTLAVGPFVSAQEYEPATTSYPAADPDGEILNAIQPEIEAEKSFNVHLNNGEFFVEQTDLTIAGRGFDFQWKRTYRSRATGKTAMGHNWDHSYNIYIEQDGADLILHDGDFRADRFEPTATPDTWASLGQFRTIYFKDGGTPSDQSDDRYVVVLRHNSKWILNPFNGTSTEGKIRSIIDRNGNVMLLEYAARTGRLVRIKDTLHEDINNPRVIQVRYNLNGTIKEIEDFCTDLGIGGAGRKVTYTYWTGAFRDLGEPGDLRSVTSPAVVGTSTGNDFPLGKTWNYEYTVGSSNDSLKHNLVAAMDPNGQYVVANAYYEGAPESYVFDRVVRQRITGFNGPQFNYWYETRTPSASNNNADHLTIVNDRMGNVCELFYENQALALVREYSGRAPDATIITKPTTNRPTGKLRPGIDPVFWETKITNNVDGLVEEVVSPNAETQTFCYDTDDLEPRSRANLLNMLVTPGTGLSPVNDFTDLSQAWSHISIFNKRAGFVDFRGLNSALRYEGPGVVEPFDSCTPPAALTSTDDRRFVPLLGHPQATYAVETISPGSMEPDPSILYSGSADQSNGDSGESGGEEPNSGGGGGCAGVDCPPLAMTSASALTACNCYDYVLNDAGQRTMAVDPEGMTTSYVYYDTPPMHGYLHQVITDPTGEILVESYTYDLAGHVTSYTDPNGNLTTYEVNALGQVVRETGPSPSNIELQTHYDANDNVFRRDIENVESLVAGDTVVASNPWFTTTYTFDILNYPTSVTREIDSSNVPNEEFEFLTTQEFEYDDNQNLSLIKRGESVNGNQVNNTVGFVWDERDLLLDETQAPGSGISSTTRYDYDDNENLMTRSVGTEALMDARVFQYEFNGYDRLKLVTDPMGNELAYDYDESGNISKKTWNGELVDTSSAGLSNELLREISYTWDDRDRLEDATHLFFQYGDSTPYPTSTLTNEYNGVNQISARVDALARRTDFEYDTVHRGDRNVDALLNVSEILDFDQNSNPLTIREVDLSTFSASPIAAIAVTTFEYDELDRLRKSEDSAENITEFGYDSRGNRIQTIDANGVETRYAFDGLNRMVSTVIDMDNNGADAGHIEDIVTQQVWDDSSRLIAQVDDSGNTTRYAFDELNRQIVKRMADGTLHQVGSGAVWGSGLLVPDLSSFLSGYDVHSNKVLTIDANGTSMVGEYDDNNRLTTRTIPPGPANIKGSRVETYTYDGLGRIVKAENDDSIVSRTYDSMDNLIEEDLSISGAAGKKTARTFDKVGNETLCNYPGPRSVGTSYDDLNRKSSTGTDVDFYYLGRHLIEAREFGSQALTSRYLYDYATGAVRTPTKIQHGGIVSTSVSFSTYDWDGVGNKLEKKNDLTTVVHNYQYDDAYRLIDTVVADVGAATTPRSTNYLLDGVHNRETVTETLLGGSPDIMNYTMDVGAPEFDSELNQYSSTPFDSRVYDANGNWIEKIDPAAPTPALATIFYDAFNRMVEYQEISGEVHLYKYDCFGRRIAKVVDSTGLMPEETRFFYGGRDNWHVIEEQDGSGATLATYVYGNGVDELISMQRDLSSPPGPETYFYAIDEQNTVVALAEYNGASLPVTVKERYEYGDYGEPTIFDGGGTEITASAMSNSSLFTGRRFDAEIGLFYYRTRYMDPAVGRFTTRDTIGIWGDRFQSGNGLSYVGNGPNSKTDPMGLEVKIMTRGLHFTNSAGKFAGRIFTHSYIQVTTSSGAVTTYSGILADNPTSGAKDQLNVFKDYPIDVNTNDPWRTNDQSAVVDIPKGMTSDEFDQAVIDAGEYEVGLTKAGKTREYTLFGAGGFWNAAIFRNKKLSKNLRRRKGNCNDLTRLLINRAGGEVPSSLNPTGFDTGLRQPLPPPGPRPPYVHTSQNYCFIGSTLISLHSGQLIEIQDLKDGTEVWTRNETVLGASGEATDCRITALVHVVVDIELPQEHITSDLKHPYWVVGKGWTIARDVQQGMRLQDHLGRPIPVVSVRRVLVPRGEPVYNFHVNRYNVYYVGSSRILVHNR